MEEEGLQPTTARGPVTKVKEDLNWQHLGEGRYQTRDGVLDLLADGEATVKHMEVKLGRNSFGRESCTSNRTWLLMI